MTKLEFFKELQGRIRSLPRTEQDKAVFYYREIIDDSMEEGVGEEEAVARLGEIGLIADGIIADYADQSRRYNEPAGRKIWITILLVLGFPLWGSLMLAASCLFLVFYILIYIPVLILGVLSIGFFLGGIWAVIGSPILMAEAFPMGLIQLGTGIAILGLSVLCVIALVYTTRSIVRVSKTVWNKVGNSFRRKVAA